MLECKTFVKSLKCIKWDEWLSDREIYIICKYITPMFAKKGSVIFTDGEHDESFGIIVEGSIDIIKNNIKIATLTHSQTFGEMALLNGDTRSADGIAAEDVIIFFITKPSLIKISKVDSKLGFNIIWELAKLVSSHLRQTTKELSELKQENNYGT